MVLKGYAQLDTDVPYQFTDGDHFAGGDVISITVMALFHDFPGGVGHIGHIDKGAGGDAAAVQLQLAPQQNKQNSAGNNAVELLAGPIDIGGACGNHRKVVGRMESAQAHVGGSARHGIGRTGIERETFIHKAGAAAIHLWRRDMYIAL